MKKLKRMMLAATIAAVMLICGCSTSTPDMTPHETDTVPTAGPTPSVDTKIVLNNLDSEIELEVRDSKLMINKLSTSESGKNIVAQNSEFALPAMVDVLYTKLGFVGAINVPCTWTYTGNRVYEAEEKSIKQIVAEYTFEEQEKNLAIRVNCISRPSLAGPFEFYTVVENKNPAAADKAYYIIPRDYASLTLGATEKDITVWSIKKESSIAEGCVDNDPEGTVVEGTGIYKYTYKYDAEKGFPNVKTTAWTTTKFFYNKDEYIPMLYADIDSECGVYMTIESTSGKITAKEGNNKNELELSASSDYSEKDDENIFKTKLMGTQSVKLPPVYIGVYDGDTDDGSNVFKSWFFDCKAPDNLKNDPREPLSEMDMQNGLTGADYGIESIKWDYGWWTTHGFEAPYSYEGSWILRNPAVIAEIERYGCKTLEEFGRLVNEKGLNWTMYLLLHENLDLNGKPTADAGEFSSLIHPEWFSDRAAVGGASADLGNEECLEYLKKTMTDFMNKNSIKTWRSDFEPICYSSDKENRHSADGTDVMYWCSEGFRELIEYLQENVEGFRYESCSCGGSMKDLFTATLATIINCDDSSNYLSLRTSFYDSSYVIHPSQLQMICNPDTFNTYIATCLPHYNQEDFPEDFDLHSAVLDMGFRSTVLSGPMWGSWTGTLMFDYYQKYSTLFAQKIRPLVRNGDLYHILPRPDGINWDGIMYSDKDSENEIKGVVFLFKPSLEAENVKNIVLRGLDKDTLYTLTFEDRPEQNVTLSGEMLMTVGIDVAIEYVGSEIIWITEA